MTFGLLHYDYEHYADYAPNEVNIGDYIQSLAAKQYLTVIDKTFDRDSLAKIADDYKLIVNGWYYLDDSRHIFNSSCLPVSVHISNAKELSDGPCLKSLKNIEPIGCRDLSTLEFLESRGIRAYFSSCLTTTLDKEYKYDGERSGVIYSDVDWLVKPDQDYFPLKRWFKRLRVRKELLKILEQYRQEPTECVTHLFPLSLTHQQRFDEAEKLLRRYAKAKLVITSRIHAALPCIALGTPVILVVKNYDSLRYQGLDVFLNHVWIRNGELDINVTLDDRGMVVNNNKHIPFAEKLKMQCEQWVYQQVGKKDEN